MELTNRTQKLQWLDYLMDNHGGRHESLWGLHGFCRSASMRTVYESGIPPKLMISHPTEKDAFTWVWIHALK